MKEKKYKWHKVAASVGDIGFANNSMAEVVVAGKTLCVAFQHNELFACTAKCPHAGGRLAEGFIDGAGNVVCPLHRYKFNLKNGRNISGEGYFLKSYPVEVRNDGVFLAIEEIKLFNW
ncbi:MAG: Rieske 2Fe-2S domain-containing protein [Aquabacterium sp.]|nr:Rieske 2Fe-2S domain-containing protein [Ferruginibacter sp.]